MPIIYIIIYKPQYKACQTQTFSTNSTSWSLTFLVSGRQVKPALSMYPHFFYPSFKPLLIFSQGFNFIGALGEHNDCGSRGSQPPKRHSTDCCIHSRDFCYFDLIVFTIIFKVNWDAP